MSRQLAELIDSLLQLAPQDRPRSAQDVVFALAARRGQVADVRLAVSAIYAWVLVSAVMAFAAGRMIYGALFGDTGSGAFPGNFCSADPVGNTFRLLAVFVPGALTFIPLCTARIRDAAADYPLANAHRKAIAGILALCWLAPLAGWLAALYLRQWDGFVAVPGRQAPASWLPAVCALLGVVLVLRAWKAWREGRMAASWRRGRTVAAAAVLTTGTVLCGLCISGPARPVVQGASAVQFDSIRVAGPGRTGDLFILDNFGVRERTPGGRFLLWLNVREPCSPYFTPGHAVGQLIARHRRRRHRAAGRLRDISVCMRCSAGRISACPTASSTLS